MSRPYCLRAVECGQEDRWVGNEQDMEGPHVRGAVMMQDLRH